MKKRLIIAELDLCLPRKNVHVYIAIINHTFNHSGISLAIGNEFINCLIFLIEATI